MHNRKGFTLSELLIVVAIIAVLVAISIPIFTSQLEKSREAVDTANIRSVYAEIMSAVLTGDQHCDFYQEGVWKCVPFDLKQKQDGWMAAGINDSLSELGAQDGSPKGSGTVYVEYDPSQTPPVIIHYSDSSASSPTALSTVAGSCWNCVDGYVTYVESGYTNGYKANAIAQLFDAKGGQKLKYSSLSDNEIINAQLGQGYKYKIGLFYLDPNDSNSSGGLKMLFDSSETNLPVDANFFTVNRNVQANQDVKVAVQIFKYETDANGNYTGKPVAMTNEEAAAFASLFHVE